VGGGVAFFKRPDGLSFINDSYDLGTAATPQDADERSSMFFSLVFSGEQ
jgi:hypothetical protein